jgi:hypothetical protein
MAQTQTPYGLLARWHPSGQARSNQYENVLVSGQTPAIYYGTPVILARQTSTGTTMSVPTFQSTGAAGTAVSVNLGVSVPQNQVILLPAEATASGDNSGSATGNGFVKLAGSFAGVEYTDLNGRRQYSKFWTSGLQTYPGTYTLAYIWDDPENVYQIQADAAVTTVTGLGTATFTGIFGLQFNLNVTDLGVGGNPAGNAVPVGQSAQRLAMSLLRATGSQGQLMVVQPPDSSSPVGNVTDPFPDLYVKICGRQLGASYVSI